MTSKVSTAMVLAAGLGQRMRPLTDSMPKPMVKLAGKPLIDHVLDKLSEAGITRAIVNVHYCADVLEAHLAQRRTAPEIILSDERDGLLDTGGAVVKALPLIGDEPFLLHNSDSTWIEGVGRNLDRLIENWDPERMDSLLLVALGSHSLGYHGPGDFSLSPLGLLERRAERNVAPFVFTGVSIAHPRLFEHAPEGSFSINALWDAAIARGRLYGIRLDGWWMHVGTPEALTEAEDWIEDASKRV